MTLTLNYFNLNIDERMAIALRSHHATEQLQTLLNDLSEWSEEDDESLSESDYLKSPAFVERVKEYLQDGAIPCYLKFKSHYNEKIPSDDIWEVIFRLKREDLFELFLDADARWKDYREDLKVIPYSQSGHFFTRTLQNAPGSFCKILLNRGMNPNIATKNENKDLWTSNENQQMWSALAWAVNAGNDAAMNFLLQEGAIPEKALGPAPQKISKYPYPTSLLHLVKTPEAVQKLVEIGVDIHQEDTFGRTALEIFITNRSRLGQINYTKDYQYRLLKSFLENGACCQVEKEGKSWHALPEYIQDNKNGCRELLVRHGALWPNNLEPPSAEAALFLEKEKIVSLDWKKHGSTWLKKWIDQGDFCEYDNENTKSEKTQTKALEMLAQQGHIDVNQRIPKTGELPLLYALKRVRGTLNNDIKGIIHALMAAGLDLSTRPAGDDAPCWGDILKRHESGQESLEKWTQDRPEERRAAQQWLLEQALPNADPRPKNRL